MTSHELARRLLEMPDKPVVLVVYGPSQMGDDRYAGVFKYSIVEHDDSHHLLASAEPDDEDDEDESGSQD